MKTRRIIRRSLCAIAAMAGALAASQPAMAWGANGHRIVGAIAQAGFEHVWSSDISEVAVAQMARRWRERGLPEGRWYERPAEPRKTPRGPPTGPPLKKI